MPKVEGFDAFRVTMPRGRRPESILVRLTADDGSVGWGEVSPAVDTSDTSEADRIWSDIEERIAPALLGLDWERPEDVAGLAQLGTRDAAAAVDIACWDLWCHGRGVPLAHALGGTRTSVVTGARIDGEPPLDALVAQVNKYVGGGYARVTLGIRPGWDIEPVRAVRHTFPALALHVDAGGSYTESPEHLDALGALDAYGPVVIERPFARDDLSAHARLQQQVATPVAPDLRDLDSLVAAIAIEAGRALGVRLQHFGGLTAARAAHDRAYAAGWDVWCGGRAPFGIAQAATVALAAMPGCTLPSDVTDLSGGPEFLSPPVRSHGGVVAVPLTRSGLGHDIDEARIAKLATRTLRLPIK